MTSQDPPNRSTPPDVAPPRHVSIGVQIRELFRRHPESTWSPADVQRELGLASQGSTIRQTLFRLCRASFLEREDYGRYRLRPEVAVGKTLWWTSWEQTGIDGRPSSWPPPDDVLAFWVTGYEEDHVNVVALIAAKTQEVARAVVASAWAPGIQGWRICRPYEDLGPPGDRFPIPAWSLELGRWPWPARAGEPKLGQRSRRTRRPRNRKNGEASSGQTLAEEVVWAVIYGTKLAHQPDASFGQCMQAATSGVLALHDEDVLGHLDAPTRRMVASLVAPDRVGGAGDQKRESDAQVPDASTEPARRAPEERP